MKKLLAVIILLFAIKSYSQSYYKNLFDNLDYDTSISKSDSPDQLDFSWVVPAHMEALTLMYEKTGEKKYAETLIKCIGNIIDRRDDLRGQKPSLGLSNISDYRDSIGSVWSTNHYNLPGEIKPYAHMVHSANIIYPMAKFAAIIKKDSTLHHLVSDPVLLGRYANQTYITIANDLIQRIKETLEYHEDQWHTEPYPNSNPSDSMRIGYYKERDTANGFTPPIKYKGIISPLNMQSAIGRVFVQMYRATLAPQYLTKVQQIANFIKSNTVLDSNLGSNKWTYWKVDDLREDISHGGLTISFPYECQKYNILKNGISIYTPDDIEAYTKTLTKDIYKSPLSVNNGVNYTSESWNFKSPGLVGKVGGADNDTYICYSWLCLSHADRAIYQLIADIQAAESYYTPMQVEKSSLTLALLAYYENLIVPVNTDHTYEAYSDWRGVASGNFDGDAAEEFVVIRNHDGMIATLEPYNKKFDSVTTKKVYDSSYNWKGLAAGDFFGDAKSEIIALSNHADYNNNGFYVLKIENNEIIEQAKYTGFGAQSDWAGIAAGNFISGGKDDFIAVRNYDKELLVCKFNGTVAQSVYTNQLNLPVNSTIKAVAAGNLDDDTKDEIVLLVDAADNTKNGIYVYDIDDNGVLTEITKSTGWGTDSDWKGLAVGDLDGDGIAEIVAHRNFDGIYRAFKLNGGRLFTAGSEIFPIPQTKDNVMCFGKFDPSSQNEELVTLRKDGGIVMFSAAKVINSINNMNNNRSSDPCQEEMPSQLFSFLTP